MLADTASFVVIAFGALIAVMCVWGMIAPVKLIGLVKRVAERPSGLVVAVVVRIVLGAALILAASASMFPDVFTVLGWIVIAAAVGILIIGRKGMQRMIAWFTGLSPTIVRAWLVFGLLFGAFLVHAAR